MKPGDVVVAEFEGTLNVKPRPAIVISTVFYHTQRPDVLLALITTQVEKATAETDVVLQDWLEAGLHNPSAVRIFLSTQERYRVRRIGTLSDRDWQTVKDRLRKSISFS